MHEPATARLARDGNIEFIVTGGFNQRDMNKWIFHRDGATNLLKQIDAHMPQILDAGNHLVPLALCARICRTNANHILTLIFDGHLQIRGFDSTAVGIQRYLVSKAEARLSVRRDRVPGLTLREAVKRIGLPSDCIHSFADGGLLKTVHYGRIRAVAEEEVERFIREYITVPQLSEITGLRWKDVKRTLGDAGVPPVAKRPEFKQILYERGRALQVLRR
jgi:hypothetical protein